MEENTGQNRLTGIKLVDFLEQCQDSSIEVGWSFLKNGAGTLGYSFTKMTCT